MAEIVTDRRRIEAEPDEGAHARAVALGSRFVEVRVELARELLRIEVTKTYVVHDCVSIEEYGARFIGIAARDAREIVDLGRALDVAPAPELARSLGVAAAGAEPVAGTGAESGAGAGAATVGVTVADAVRAGALSIERAAAVGRIVRTPGVVRDGEDPVALAMAGSMHQVRTMIRVREEEIAQGVAVVPISLAVTVRARDGFRRARSLASERAGEMLTEGETFSVVIEHYLESFDPSRVGEGARRVVDTSELPGQRYIPVAVQRAVRERSGEQCEVPGCPRRTFLEFAHVEPHRVGGSREEANLVRVCGGHHVLIDAGRIRVTTAVGGRPKFHDARRRMLEDRTARSRPDDVVAAAPSDGGPQNAEAHDATSAGAAGRAIDGAPRRGDLGEHGSERPGGAWGDVLGAAFRDAFDSGDAGAGQVAERPPPYGCATSRERPTRGIARATEECRGRFRDAETVVTGSRLCRCRPPPGVNRSRTSRLARAEGRCPS